MASCFLSLRISVWEIGVTNVILGGCCGCGRVGVGMRMSGAPCGRIVASRGEWSDVVPSWRTLVLVVPGGLSQLMRTSSILLLVLEVGWCQVCVLGVSGVSRGWWCVWVVNSWCWVSLGNGLSLFLSGGSKVAFISPTQMWLPLDEMS